MPRITTAAVLAVIAVLTVASVALGQDDGGGVPVSSDLASLAGVTAVAALVMQGLRVVLPAGVFDQWGATLALITGIVIAALGALTIQNTGEPVVWLDVAILGLASGLLTQNVNKVVTRAANPPPTI